MLLADKTVSDTVRFISNTLQKSIVIDYFHEEIESTFMNPSDELVYRTWRDTREDCIDKSGFINTFPIHANDTNLGRMVVMGEEKLTNKERMIIKRALLICTIQMFHQMKLTQTIWKRKEDFFKGILNNHYDKSLLKQKMHTFDYNPALANRVFTLKMTPQTKMKEVLQYLSVIYKKIDVFTEKKHIILIAPAEKCLEVETFVSQLQSTVLKEFKSAKMHIGAGRITTNLQDLATSYRDASSICDFIQLAHPNSSRASYYEELEPVIMFRKGADQEELIEFSKDNIGKLFEYDADNSGTLVLTLKTYLDHNGNLRKAAEELHLSIAGLRYRIERIESLCQTDLNTGTSRFNFQLAIKIHFALQVIEKQLI